MSDIEQARAVIKRWGAGATLEPWWAIDGEIWADYREFPGEARPIGRMENPADAILASAMADPELREALDGILELAQQYGALPRGRGSRFIERAEHLAATIIASDRKMNS